MTPKNNKHSMAKRIDPERPVYPIGVVAELTGIKPQTLRIYEENGLITPSRSSKNRRLYSNNDVEKIEYLYYLTQIRKVGIRGVKVILEILDQIPEEQRQRIMSAVVEKGGNHKEDGK